MLQIIWEACTQAPRLKENLRTPFYHPLCNKNWTVVSRHSQEKLRRNPLGNRVILKFDEGKKLESKNIEHS